MELYKYTGSVAALTVRFGKAETITLYDSYDDSVAPVRLDVRGALAEYIKEIESTDSEERYMNLDWYYDFNMLLRRIEVPGVPSGKALKTVVPAKVLTQTRSNPDELVCFGCPDFINTTKPVSMGQMITRTSSCGSARTETKEGLHHAYFQRGQPYRCLVWAERFRGTFHRQLPLRLQSA